MASVKRNGYYNNPDIGAAFDNLASVFAPPSGADVQGFSQAALNTQKKQQLADFFAHATNPNASRDEIDRYGIASGTYNPNQSYYGVDQTNLTSRANNTADNSRALDQTKLQQEGDTTRKLLEPVGEGQTRFVPPSLADQFKIDPQQNGVVKLNPGEEANVPGGAVVKGAPKPLTKAEVEGNIIAGLSPAEQRAVGLSGVEVESVLDENGKPVVKFRPDAVGQRPVQKTSDLGTAYNYTTPDGGSGTARYNGEGKLADTQTGEVLPAGVKVYTANAQGTPDQFGKSTESENKTAYAASMADQATLSIIKQFDEKKLPSAGDYQAFQLMNNTPAALHPLIVSKMSPQGQTFYQGVRTALPLQLMVQSGLATTEAEAQRKLVELVPVPGEDPQVTEMKRAQFLTFFQTAHGLAGKAAMAKAKSLQDAPALPADATPMPPAGAPTMPPASNKPVRWVVQDGKLVQAQ